MPRRLVILTKSCFDLSIYWSRSTFADIQLARFFNVLSHDLELIMRCWYYFVGSQKDFCDGGKMVVRFFQFLWLLWILTSSEAKTTFIGTKQGSLQSFSFLFPLELVNMFFPKNWSCDVCFNSSAVDRTAYRTGSYGGRVTTRYFHETKPIKHQNTPSEGVLKTHYGRKNSKMNSKRRVSQLKPKRNNTTRQTRNSLSSTVHEDLPELYILVLVSHVHFRWFHKCIRNPAGCLFVKSVFF